MKKFFAIIIAAILIFSLVGCAKDNNKTNDTTEPQTEGTAAIKDGAELLNTVFNSYSEDEKFSVAGGDSSEENMKTGEAGIFSVSDADALDSTLGFPAASVDKIDGAASLMHMMNANTFTCGAYHVKNSADVTAVADAIKANIMNRRWMCGFPDKLVVAVTGDYVVAFFGETEIMDTFKAKLTAAYADTQIVTEEAIQ